MSNPVLQSSFRYLNVIFEALNRFYQNDYELLCDSRRTHEQTVSFRVAKYLADQLENQSSNMRVDCEYHGDVYSASRRKALNGIHIRPDIIYHDRKQRNEFCIEMKIASPTPYDFSKVNGMIIDYGYHEGYCISNVGKHFVTVYAISPMDPDKGKRIRLRFDSSKRILELT